jgi:hypothetical protein
MSIRLLRDIGAIILVLLLTVLPGALFLADLRFGTISGFGLVMLILLPFASAGLLLASPFLLLLRLIGHDSWWSRLGLAICAGAVLGLGLGYASDSDVVAVFNAHEAALGAGVGAVFGLWAGAWWCFFFRGRALERANLRKAARSSGRAIEDQ